MEQASSSDLTTNPSNICKVLVASTVSKPLARHISLSDCHDRLRSIDKVKELRQLEVLLHSLDSYIVPKGVESLQLELLDPGQVSHGYGHCPVTPIKSLLPVLISCNCEEGVSPRSDTYISPNSADHFK